MSDVFKDHFSTMSEKYADFRPRYPKKLVEELANLCVKTDMALDCGCGTGQLSVLLSEFFECVVATDASSKQIENAKPCEGVLYRVATAENSQLPSSSVDLVTVAQAAHWLDLDKFYREVVRISKPNGVLALISYGVLRIDYPECDRIVHQFYYSILGAYWPPERKLVEAGYTTLPFSFDEVELPRLDMEESWSFDQLYGYITTWSAFKSLENAGGTIEIERFKNDLAAAWGSLEVRRTITWPLSLRVGRVNYRSENKNI